MTLSLFAMFLVGQIVIALVVIRAIQAIIRWSKKK